MVISGEQDFNREDSNRIMMSVNVILTDVEQITKADRLRMSRPLQKGKARAMLRRLSSTVLRS